MSNNPVQKLKSKLSNSVTIISEKTQMDRTQAKLALTILILLIVSFIDIVWIVVPFHPFHKPKPKPEYTMAEVPTLLNKYQTIISNDPNNFEAHYELGKIYLFLKDKEKAKIELFMAVENAPKGNYNPNFLIATIFVQEKKPEMAEKMVDEIEYTNLSKTDFTRKADLLFDISKLYYGNNNFNASYGTLQEAYNDYAQSNNTEKLELAKTDMISLLVDMADQAYYVEKNPTKAIIYLDNAQKIEENAYAYARMGYLFFDDPRLSAEYFDKAYSFAPTSVNLEVFIYTLAQAIEQCKRENRMSDKSYYRGVMERVRSENLVAKINKNIIVNNLEGLFEKQGNSDEYLPIIYFDVYNASKDKPINYLKIRAVFVDINAKIVGHRDMILVNTAKPLQPHKTIPEVRVESNRPIALKDKQNNLYTVLIYVSKNRPDSWAYATTKMLQ
jgi:tetratricopeptide (TPR) repeat protein